MAVFARKQPFLSVYEILFIAWRTDICLSGRKTCDRHTERRAGNIGETDVVAELDGGRIAAVLAADTAAHARTGRSAQLDRHLHQLADADGVQTSEGIGLVDLVRIVCRKELAGIVTGEAKRHLREVVGAEAEELRFLRDLVCGERSARDLDHRTNFIVKLDVRLFDDLVRRLDDDVLDELHFLCLARQRDHDLGNDVPVGMIALDVDRSLDDGLGLHDGDFGIGDGETAAAVTHHGVELVQVGDDLLDLRDRLALRLCKRFNIGFLGGNELVKRRIEEADGDRIAAERLEQAFEVRLLHGLDLGKRRLSLLNGIGADHFTECADSRRLKEHVLGTAKTNALRAERSCLLCILGRIGIRSDAERLVLVRKLHDAAEVAGVGICGNGGNEAVINVTRGAVEGQDVTLLEQLAGERELLVLLVHLDIAAAGDAARTHAARDDCRVRGLTAADSKDALRELHALDVLRRGLETDKDDLLACLAFLDGVLSREDDGTCSGAGGCSDTLADDVVLVCFLERLGIELRVQEHVEGLRVNLHERFLLGDHALVDEVACDLDRSGSRALAVTGLEHIELALFDGELHILHVMVVVLKNLADFLELLVDIGEDLCHLGNRHRRTDARDDVLALCVGEELAHQALFARCGVTRERDARAAVVAHVAERHHLHVDRGTPAVGNVVVHTVDVRTGVVPRTEDRLDRSKELLLGIVGEVGAELVLVLRLELVRKFLQVLCGQLDVLRDALLLLHLVDELLEVLLADLHDDVGEHLDESSVAVPSPTRVVRLLSDGVDDRLVEAEVEDGVHHAGHGSARARTDGDEQGIFLIAELLAADLLHLLDVLHDLCLDLGIDLPAVLVVLRAGFRGDRETLRHGQTDVGHFREVCALAAEQLTHLCITFREQVTILFCHECFSS